MALADFRVNEVVVEAAGSPDNRFIELFVPLGTAGNCVFPTTRIEVFDSNGQLLGAVAPFASTVCYEPGSYFLLATPEAATHFGVTRDAKLDVAIPAAAGQVCLASSATRYDCARWGVIHQAVRFLRNTDDDSAAAPMPPGVALARIADSGVVSADFAFSAPTPRQPNDGSILPVADAGAAAPDAAGAPDAPLPDARIFTRPDAALPARPDASSFEPVFLDADPGGGAACACRAGASSPERPFGVLGAIALVLLRRRLWRRRRA